METRNGNKKWKKPAVSAAALSQTSNMRMPRLRPSLSVLAAATAMRRPMMTANLVQPRDAAADLFVLEQTDKVKSPPRDKKQYRWLRASNGLRVLLVHDPDTEKAAAALEVHAGHFSDPDERPGLAHFTEHVMSHRGVEARPGTAGQRGPGG